jgi:shikimate dehydrogenase
MRTVPLLDTAALTDEIRQSSLLVQTTRVGMHPDDGVVPPVDPEAMHPDLLVYDLVYNPVETGLIRLACKRGCKTMTGIKMLVHQGAASFERWTGIAPPIEVMEDAVLRALGQ